MLEIFVSFWLCCVLFASIHYFPNIKLIHIYSVSSFCFGLLKASVRLFQFCILHVVCLCPLESPLGLLYANFNLLISLFWNLICLKLQVNSPSSSKLHVSNSSFDISSVVWVIRYSKVSTKSDRHHASVILIFTLVCMVRLCM